MFGGRKKYYQEMIRIDRDLNDLDNFITRDAFAKYLGIEVVEFSKGAATARLDIQEHHLNSHGTVHGGVIFSLADSVFAVASNSHEGLAMAINVSISYFKAVKNGTLTAIATEESINQKLATYLVDISDDAGNRVALFLGTVYRKHIIDQ